VRFDDVDIPLKRMKKSKNARRKLFPFSWDTVKKPRGRILDSSSCSLHSRVNGGRGLQESSGILGIYLTPPDTTDCG
jgi:hypothetical protein